MEEWVDFYERVLGMTEMIHFDDKDDLAPSTRR